MSNVETAYEYFLGQGFTSAQSSGIVGNLIQESGVNPESIQKSGPGRGIAQWSLGGRWLPSLMTGNPSTDLANQEQYIIDELQSDPAYGLAALRQANTPTQAAQIFGTQYERYGIQGARLQDAQQVFNEAQTNNWPVASTSTLSNTSINTTSVSGDLWSAVKNAIIPGWGMQNPISTLSDVGKIADEIAAGMGLATQKEPQTLQGNTFLTSLDKLLNPSVTLLDPWNAVTMVMARGGFAMLGIAMIAAGVVIIVFGTKTGREAVGKAGEAAAAGAVMA